MNFRLRLLASVIAPVLAISQASSARAGMIVDITNDAKGGVGQLADLTWTFAGSTETGLAGTLTTTLPGGLSVDTYCVDLFDTTYVGNGGSTWSAEILPITSFVGNPAGNPTGGNGGAIGYLYSQFAAAVTDRIEGAALQIAIWKVEYDNSPNFGTGNFQFADSSDPNSDQHQVFVQASAYLAGFDGTQSSGDATLFRATSHPNSLYQDLVGPGSIPGFVVPNVSAVPEPSSIVLVLSGLGGVALVRRRRAARLA